MRIHLLEETTVRTEWTPASGPVDAYEIQFSPMVRQDGQHWGEGEERARIMHEVTLIRLQMTGTRVCSKCLLTVLQPGTEASTLVCGS